tara:strand:+ start:2144 stop:2449 length:306 start_codon:yes stop_codon:yes gene_type:complete
MSYWNYRVIFHPAGTVKMASGKHVPYEAYYGLHEVHYRDGKPWAYTEDPISVVDFLEEEIDENEVYNRFNEILADMKRGVNTPTLKEDDFRPTTKNDDREV